MPSPLTNALLASFRKVEDRVQTHDPEARPKLSIWLERDYNGNLILHYDLGSNGWSGDLVVKAKDLEDATDELLRRMGFQAQQNAILLEPPAIEPTPQAPDDEIPF